MTGAPRIVFVTETGPAVGWGHLARCLALARAAGGSDVRHLFLVEGGGPSALERIRLAGFDAVSPPWRSDPHTALRKIRGLAADATVAVVDAYGVAPQFLIDLRAAVGCLAIVDDVADRISPADVIVNGGLGAARSLYPPRGGGDYLVGPEYALLDPAFRRRPVRDAADPVARVLVTLGGGRPGDDLRAAVAAVDRVFAGCQVDVAVGASGDGPPSSRTERTARNEVTTHHGLPGLRDLMVEADLAVAGAGVTFLELLACARPAVLVRMADNQGPNVEEGLRRRVALCAGVAGDASLGECIETALRQLAADPARRREMGELGRRLVDGRGACRVAGELAKAAVAGR